MEVDGNEGDAHTVGLAIASTAAVQAAIIARTRDKRELPSAAPRTSEVMVRLVFG